MNWVREKVDKKRGSKHYVRDNKDGNRDERCDNDGREDGDKV